MSVLYRLIIKDVLGKGTGVGINNSAVYFMGARLIFVLSAYALHIFAAYYFDDPRIYGNLAVALSINAISMIFIQFGFPQAISKLISENQEDGVGILSEGRRISFKFSVIIFFIYILSIPFWVYITKDASLYMVIFISSFLIPVFSFNSSYMSYLNGKQKFKEQAFFVSLYPLNRIVLAILFVFLGFGVPGIFMGFVFAGLINSYCLNKKIRIPLNPRKIYSERLIQFALPIIFLSIGISLFMNIDMIIVKHYFFDEPNVGFYAASSNIGKISYYVYFAYAMTILPIVSKNVACNDYVSAIYSIKKCIISLLFLVAFSSAFVSYFSSYIIDFVYPEGYSSLSNIMSILFLSMGLLSIFQALSSIMIALGKIIVSTCVIYMMFALEIFISIVCIPKYGIMGMAIANIVPVFVGSVALGVVLKYYLYSFVTLGVKGK